MLKKTFTLLLIIGAIQSKAQSFQKTDLGLQTVVNGNNIEIQFYNPDVVRIIKYPVGAKFYKNSYSVVERPAKTEFTVTKTNNNLVLTSNALKVQVDVNTGKIQYLTPANKLLLAEKDNGAQFTSVVDTGKNSYSISQDFTLANNEAVYGLGQHQKGIMNYRNKTVVLRNLNMDIAVPFFQTSGGYGVFWDNYSTTTFKDNAGTTTLQSVLGDGIDYYFMNGGNADGVVAKMRTLTGDAPMFPRWVFGFFQSRERYKSQTEVVGIVKKYRALNVPLDGIVQDWQYWGTKETSWNSTEFGNPLYPEPKKMIDSVHALNAHIIISVWPSFGPNTAILKAMDNIKALFDFKTWPTTQGVKVYDPFNPIARNVYWDFMNRNIFSLGMDGWWLDATEPEQANTNNTDKVRTYAGSFKSVSNAFPLLTTGGVYEHQRRTSADKRVFILTRSAFAGQQRDATATWSGDIQGTWQSFRNQISGGLNLSLSAIPYWNTDIGGFFSATKYPKGIKDAAFHELYTRWFEFATFTPLMRSHGTSTPREIFQFGAKGSWAYDAQEKFINLRYRLLPYNYSNAWQITAHQSTMMRALVMDFPKDEKVFDINNEYMFGKAFLVAPVTDSLYVSRATGNAVTDFGTVKTQHVYLPKGSTWTDFWTGETYTGGNIIASKVPIDQIPLFVKAGSIIPFGPFQQYTSEKKADKLEIRIYPGANGTFTLYEDENDNYNYESGVYSTIDFKWNNQTKTLTIDNRKGTFPDMLKDRVFNLVLVNKTSGTGLAIGKTIKTIRYSGAQIQTKL
ncbi:TIM-barrel domain-containing protein [Mucilaginibacter sp.]|uniref:glycoside hydrolase family 31 protein n=1 Tax=Mucilaginibacter sp. TaxID=1882438 RepID=UPI00262A4B9C|nr:TIM-barrel domain-containing protein [Mucilaginibacter sp.]MDB5029384.1 xylosidase [Mucilaginibacter sp.]